MKNLFFIVLLICPFLLWGQNVHFSFANAEVTTSQGKYWYETDVILQAQTEAGAFKMSSGQLYFNYNTQAFGSLVSRSGKLQVSYPSTHLLGTLDNSQGIMRVYSEVVKNDNTDGRFSISWQQDRAGNCIEPNVNSNPTPLFHLKLDFLAGASGELPELCFETSETFTNQIYTLCGPSSGSCNFSKASCSHHPGNQIADESFDCASITNTSTANTDLENEQSLEIFPNPVQKEMTVQFVSQHTLEGTIEVRDLLGRVVYSKNHSLQKGPNEWKIDATNWAQGSYFIEIKEKEAEEGITQKFVKVD